MCVWVEKVKESQRAKGSASLRSADAATATAAAGNSNGAPAAATLHFFFYCFFFLVFRQFNKLFGQQRLEKEAWVNKLCKPQRWSTADNAAAVVVVGGDDDDGALLFDIHAYIVCIKEATKSEVNGRRTRDASAC